MELWDLLVPQCQGFYECPRGVCTPSPPHRVVTGDAEASLLVPVFETLTEAPETATVSVVRAGRPQERGHSE